MALVLKDRVKETTTTTGTGTITLAGASTGYQSFSAVGNGNTTYYTIADQTGTNWEVGIGTYTASGTTLSRDTVLSSSNSGALVNFGSGTKDVFVTYPSEFSNTAQVGDVVLSSVAPTGPGTWLETGKYYSKAAYPALATALGSVADFGTPSSVPAAQLPQPFAAASSSNPYLTATDGSVTVAVGTGGAIRKTTDGVNWVGVPSTTTSTLTEVRYLNGNFIAVGGSGAVGVLVTSTDGTTWVQRGTSGNNNASGTNNSLLLSVAYGGGKYVAVGAQGTILYSSDLITWTLVTTAANTGSFTRVAYGGGTFVAVGTAGIVYSSTDGVTWTARTFQTTALVDVVYANSLFVAITSSGVPWYSADGIGWSSQYATFAATAVGANNITATDGVTTVAVGTSGAIRKTTDGSTWLAVTSRTTQSLYEVQYLNSNFIAVGAVGTIVSSTDGTTWTARTSGASGTLFSVAYGNSKYVVVSTAGVVLYSSDLVNWATASGTGTSAFYRVIYANSLFVAVGVNGALYTSSDGVTWTSRSAGSQTFNDVIYENSLFVAVGNGGACYTSSDGVTWTSRSAGGALLRKVTYGNSLFVAVGLNVIYTSSDGATWTSRTIPSYTSAAYAGTVTLYSVAWNGTSFVAVGQYGRYVTSSDGITWTSYNDISVAEFYAVSVVNSKTIAFGHSSCVILAGATRAEVMQSGTWSFTINAAISNQRLVAYDGSSTYVACGGANTIYGMLMSSSDGVSWTAGSFLPVQDNYIVTQYVNGNFVALGQYGSLAYSSNGTSWTQADTGTAAAKYAIAYGAGVYVTVGAGNAGAGYALSSPDLTTWTSRSAGSNTLNDVIFANSLFVAVGNTGVVYTTPDGVTWTYRSAGSSAFQRIIYANSLFVAVGASGVIYTSTDGITWTSRTSNVASQLNDVTWNGSLFCAVGASGAITTSPDGVTWTARVSGSTNTLTSVSWSGSAFLVTNTTNSNVLVSSDGTNWFTYATQFGGTFLYSTYAGGKFVAIGSNKVASSTNGIAWTPGSPVQFTALPGVSNTRSVTYSNSKFVISGTGTVNNIATSTDGVTWSALFAGQAYTSASQGWHYCLWNGSSYYLVGDNGRYATSSDAATWTVAQDASVSSFYSVGVVSGKTIAYGATSCVLLAGATRAEVLQNGTWNYSVAAQLAANPRTIAYNGSNQYVAAGNNGVILTSSDGQSWTGRYSGVTAIFDKVQYLNGNYIALGGSGQYTNLLTSSDGVSWTSRLAGSLVFNAAAYGASIYVAVGSTGSAYSSPDLITWTSRSAGGSVTHNDVVFANSIFVAVGTGGSCYSSPDGITWTSRSAGTTQFNRIIYANSLFVAIGQSGIIYTSPDGITWTNRTSNVGAANLNDIVWNGSLFCAVGNSGVITTSPDGVTWTARTPGDTTVNLNSISWSGTRFVVTNTTNGVAWTSTDGITWTRASTVYQGTTLYSCYLGGKFLAIGSGFIQTSSDGINWTNSDPVQYVPTSINKLYKLGSNYYALTNKGMFQSTDGSTFTLAGRTLPSGAVLSMAYSGSAWVAESSAVSGQPQAFYKSTDGTTWTKAADLGTLTSSSSLLAAVDLVYANGNFISGQTITLAQNIPYSIYTSTDGVTWTGRQTPYLAAPVTAMGSDGTNTVFGSASGTFKSTDGGVTWTQLTAPASTSVIYSNGVWIFNSTNSNAVSPDLSNFYAPNISIAGLLPYNVYVSGNNIASISSFGKLYLNKSASGYVALPQINTNVAYTTISKEIPVRSTTALIVITQSNATFPNLILETPLYSYDTSTTFWIPPSNAGVGQKAYMYAGA